MAGRAPVRLHDTCPSLDDNVDLRHRDSCQTNETSSYAFCKVGRWLEGGYEATLDYSVSGILFQGGVNMQSYFPARVVTFRISGERTGEEIE